MKLKNLLKATTFMSLTIAASTAFGQDVTNVAGVEIRANNDGATTDENIVFSIGGSGADVPLQTQMTIRTDGTTIGDSLTVTGDISTDYNILVGGFIRDPNEGGTVQIADPLLVSGATDGEISLNVVGQTTLDATTIVGTTSITGATSINGTTSITGTTTVTSGGLNVTGETDLNTGLNVDGQTTLDQTTVVGETLINTSGTAATTIGNSASTTGIVGTTSITGSTTVLGTTSINTSGSDNTTIGNASTTTAIVGTTSITGGTSINTTGSSATTIGNSSAATDVTMVGGSSRIVLDNGTTSINTSGSAANTSIGVAGNNTSILSTNIVVGNETTASNVLVGAGTAANTIVMGNGVAGTVVNASAGNTAMAMQNGSITNTVLGSSEGVSGGTVIANDGSARWVADANGKLTAVTSDDETSGTTAAMVVTNSAGNTHGLVVQETKTTISGGTNSSSLTLADNGATFSDSATGRPIQVHGVADGTADFDAVNVRQLYSGLAAVLASSPEINLAPGKSGMGIGFGGYGGFSAIGIGFGHMYDNGAVVRASVSKAEHSEIAYRASVSWSW